MAAVHLVARHRNYEKADRRASGGEMFRAGLRAAPASALAFVILSLLRFGVMTATEVGIVAVLWSFVIGKFLYRGYTWPQLYHDMVECAADSALIFFLIAVASPYAWVLLAEQMPQQILGWVTAFIHVKWQMLLMVNVVTLLAGCFLEVIPTMLILVPLLTPLMVSMGVNPIHLGIIIVFNLLLAEVSPPIGILVFISASIARVPSGPVFRECLPFVLACGICLLLITFIPALSLALWPLISR
jgi:tripartite ATP-independent transporter DctM subunit